MELSKCGSTYIPLILLCLETEMGVGWRWWGGGLRSLEFQASQDYIVRLVSNIDNPQTKL